MLGTLCAWRIRRHKDGPKWELTGGPNSIFPTQKLAAAVFICGVQINLHPRPYGHPVRIFIHTFFRTHPFICIRIHARVITTATIVI